MSEFKTFYSQEEKDKFNKAALKKLNSIFKDLDKTKYTVIKNLVESVAFMTAEIKDLEAIIRRDGTIEEYRNGRFQSGYKKSAAFENYNSMMKVYSVCVQKLIDILKAESDGTAGADIGDKFDEFLSKGRNQY